MHPTDPKARFTDRVDDYVRFRPSYPQALVERLTSLCRLGPDRVVADIGAGTGIFTRLLLETGARVFAVEPNAAMRAAAEADSAKDARFESVDGSAESTTLPDASVDLITAVQAFHWFKPHEARLEFARIQRPGGLVALIWNQRRETAFNRDYEAMLERFAPDYRLVRERDRAAESRVRAFFEPTPATFESFSNAQVLDQAGVEGRLASSSYAPRAGDPVHPEILRELRAIFARHEHDGQVRIDYDTVLWHGDLATQMSERTRSRM